MDEHRFALPATKAAVTPDQLFEGCDLRRCVVEPAVDDDVPDVREMSVPANLGGSRGPESRERVQPLHHVLVEVVRATATERHDTAGVALHDSETDAVVV